MIKVNDKAGIMGSRVILTDDDKKLFSFWAAYIKNNKPQIDAVLQKYGYPINGYSTTVHNLVDAVAKHNMALLNELHSQPLNLKANLASDPVTGIADAITALFGFFGSNKNNTVGDVSGQILLIEQQKAAEARTKSILIFGGLTLLAVVAVVVVVKVSK